MTHIYELRNGFEPELFWERRQGSVVLRTKPQISAPAFPRRVALICSLNPKIEPLVTTLETVLDHESCGVKPALHGCDGAYFRGDEVAGVEHIDLRYEGEGSYEDFQGKTYGFQATTAPPFSVKFQGDALFRKEFPPIYQGHALLNAQYLGEEGFENIESRIQNHIILYSLGGVYRPGAPLEEVEPLFVTPFYRDEKTSDFVWRVSTLLEKTGMRPPYRLKLFQYVVDFYDPSPKSYYRSLADDLKAGDALITLKGHEGGTHVYQSFDYEPLGAGRIRVLFKACP